MNRITYMLVISLACATAFQAFAQPQPHGTVRHSATGDVQAWSEASQSWLTIEEFWIEYASERGGLSWGRGPDYPEYSKVNEFDTFMVETAQGPCLMEFFHQRWRRANDVRRWDNAFNDYGGCPHVFD